MHQIIEHLIVILMSKKLTALIEPISSPFLQIITLGHVLNHLKLMNSLLRYLTMINFKIIFSMDKGCLTTWQGDTN